VKTTVPWTGTEVPSDVRREELAEQNLHRTIETATLMGWRFLFVREFSMSRKEKSMNSESNKSPDPHDASKCDLCGRRSETVRPRTLIAVGTQSGAVRTKFCDQCAATVKNWNNFAPIEESTLQPRPGSAPPFEERTLVTVLDRPLTPAESEQVARHLVENAVEHDLPSGSLEKYRTIQGQTGRRVQICIPDYDETTYKFLNIRSEWTHSFWRKVCDATARRVRHEGFLVRFVNLDLSDYMEWLARENLTDCSTAREKFVACVADWEMGITATAPARALEGKKVGHNGTFAESEYQRR
jgi:hypothetical protein